MKSAKVHLELLLGKLVRDPDGVKVGRILSVRAEQEGDDCVVREYDLGAAALMARLGISTLGLIGWPFRKQPLAVPWDLLDLSDPERPQLRCPLSELNAKRRRAPS
jgi:hypothetical protein